MSSDKWAVGVDIGGTKIAVAHVDAQGNIRQRLHLNTHAARTVEEIVNDIAVACAKLMKGCPPPVGIGIGIAGQVESASGMVFFAPNLQWRNVPLKLDMERLSGFPVSITNDVRAATLGEWHYGAGKNLHDFVCLFVGTGVGGGIVSNGRLITGDNNSAGELGHITIQLHGDLCTCGNHGCFETLSGGWAIAARAKKRILENRSQGHCILQKVNHDLNAITAKTVIQAARGKDPLAAAIISEAIDGLTAGIVSIANALNPKKIILGGGIIEGLPAIIEHLRESVSKKALRSAMQGLEISSNALGMDSGIIGAASLILHLSCNKDY